VWYHSSTPARAATYYPTFQPQSRGVWLENTDTDQLIFEQNANEPMEAGYLAKLMTALMTVEYMEENGLDLDEETVALKLYIQNTRRSFGQTFVYLAGPHRIA
jgi:D-alanyl-D-alanine carboxypeptidase